MVAAEEAVDKAVAAKAAVRMPQLKPQLKPQLRARLQLLPPRTAPKDQSIFPFEAGKQSRSGAPTEAVMSSGMTASFFNQAMSSCSNLFDR
jgi:phage terminase large subunit GpA-like protein